MILPKCPVCNATHTGPCKTETRAYFVCGEVGHIARDCPHRTTQSSRGVVSSTSSGVPSSFATFMRLPSNQGGRSGGRGSFSQG